MGWRTGRDRPRGVSTRKRTSHRAALWACRAGRPTCQAAPVTRKAGRQTRRAGRLRSHEARDARSQAQPHPRECSLGPVSSIRPPPWTPVQWCPGPARWAVAPGAFPARLWTRAPREVRRSVRSSRLYRAHRERPAADPDHFRTRADPWRDRSGRPRRSGSGYCCCLHRDLPCTYEPSHNGNDCGARSWADLGALRDCAPRRTAPSTPAVLACAGCRPRLQARAPRDVPIMRRFVSSTTRSRGTLFCNRERMRASDWRYNWYWSGVNRNVTRTCFAPPGTPDGLGSEPSPPTSGSPEASGPPVGAPSSAHSPDRGGWTSAA